MASFWTRPATAGLLIASTLACENATREMSSRERPVVRVVGDQFVANISGPLVQQYSQSIPDIDVRLLVLEGGMGSTRAVEAIQRGEADLGFAQADVTYFAYRQAAAGPTAPVEQLRAIAALEVTPLHLLVRSGLNVTDVTDLRGLTVRTGPAWTGQALFANLVVRAYGFEPGSISTSSLATTLIPAGLSEGNVDAAFVVGYYPTEAVVQSMRRGARLVAINGGAADRLRREYPFVRRVVIPPGTYAGQDEQLVTIGVGRVLVCRLGLDERLVHDLTKGFVEALPQLAASLGTSLRMMNLDEAAATPIPLHPGAARYYRERELLR